MYNPRRTKILSNAQLQELKNKYVIDFQKGQVLLTLTTRNHTVAHNINNTFSVRCDNRRFTVSSTTMKLWQKHFKLYNLFDVQHAINLLAIERSQMTPEIILKKLNSNDNGRL